MLPGKRYTVDDIGKIAWRGKWIVLAPAIVTSMLAGAYLRLTPDIYRAETTILVVPQRVPDIYVKSTVTTNVQDRLRSINQQILSRTRLEPIILDFNLYPERRQKEPMEDTVNYMRDQVEVKTVRGDTFSVGYRSLSPVLAQQVAERLASLYIDENMRDRASVAEGTSQFLEAELNEARQKLVEHEKRLEAYRLRYSGELPTQATSNFQAVQTLQMQAQGLSDSLDRDRDRRLVLERSLADIAATPLTTSDTSRPDPTDAPPPPGSAAADLATAREQLRVMRTRLTPEHPDVVRGERIVRELERKAAVEREAAAAAAAASGSGTATATAGLSGAERRVRDLRQELGTVVNNIRTKEAQLTKIQDELAGYRSRLDAAPVRESELTELTRDYDTLQNSYKALLSKRQEAQIASNVERRQIGEQFRVLDPARRPERPYSPNRPLVQALGTAAGFVVGIAIIALAQVRDRTLHTEADVLQALNLPVLATVPRMRNADERKRHMRQVLGLSSAAVAGIAVAVAIAWSWLNK